MLHKDQARPTNRITPNMKTKELVMIRNKPLKKLKIISSYSNSFDILCFITKYKKDGMTIIKAPGYNDPKNLSDRIKIGI